jgi:predicted DNA-binding transcriptional regulator YafY
MKRSLMKALNEKQPVEIIYISDKQIITQRTVLVNEMSQHTIRAYCYLRKQSRLFKIHNILSVFPIKQKEPYIS